MPLRSQMARISSVDNSHALSVMTSQILFKDSASTATLTALNASTAADLKRSGLAYTARV